MTHDKSINTEQRKHLLEERDRLKNRLEAIVADYRAGLSADSSEQAVELENREVLDEIARTTREDLEKIEEALRAMR